MKKLFFDEIFGGRNFNFVGSILVIIFIISFRPSVLTANEIKTITLSQAIEIAQKCNLDLKQAENQVQLEQITVSQKKANFRPEINISAQTSQQFVNTLDHKTGVYTSGDNRSLYLNASFSRNLFNGFYDISSLKQSKFELKASEKNLTRSQQSIIFETIQHYIQVVLSEELIQVDEKNLEAQRLQLARIEDFFKAGRRPVADLYQQKAEISRYEYQLINSERNYEVNKLLLFQILGLKPNTEYQISNPGIENIIKEIKEFNRENVISRALKERPDIKARQNQIEAAKKEVKAARSGYWPKLSVFAEAGTNYSSVNDFYGFSDQILDNNLNATIGMSLAIPVFDRGVTKNNVASAKVKLKNQQLELEKLDHRVRLEVQQATEDYYTACKQINVTESQEKYSRAALKSVEERYNVNAATMAELIQVRSQYHQSLYDLAEAKFNLLIRGIAVAFYQGDGEGMIAMLEKN